MDPREELVDLIDEQDQVIGWARRKRVRKENLLHRGVGILCLDPTGRIYVHRRTTTKDVFPGMYDMFVGGVVGKGESRDLAATREIAEELGISGPIPEPLCRYLYIGPLNRSLVAVYKVVWDGKISHQVEEVEWGSYMSIEEIEAKTGEWNFVPDGLEIWRHIRELKAI